MLITIIHSENSFFYAPTDRLREVGFGIRDYRSIDDYYELASPSASDCTLLVTSGDEADIDFIDFFHSMNPNKTLIVIRSSYCLLDSTILLNSGADDSVNEDISCEELIVRIWGIVQRKKRFHAMLEKIGSLQAMHASNEIYM